MNRDRVNEFIYRAPIAALQVFMWLLLILTVGVLAAWAVSAVL